MGIPLAALAINQNQPSPLDTTARALQLKSLAQNQAYQAQAQPLELQQRQQAVAEGAYQQAARQASNKAYQNAVTIDENGQPKFDSAAVTKSLSEAGFGSEAPTILKHMQEFEQGKANLEKTHADTTKLQNDAQTHQLDMYGNMGAAIRAAGNDPAMADTFLQHFEMTPGMTPEGKQRIEQTRQQMQQNPALVKQMADSWVAQSPAQQKVEGEKAVAGIRAGTTPITDKIPQLNQALARRYQVLNPGQSLPPDLTLPADATSKDFDRIDKIMQQTEGAKATQAQQATTNAMRQQTQALAQESFKQRVETAEQGRTDKSYQFNSGQLEKVATPVDQLAARLGRLQDTLAQNSPQADALVAPELLSVMSGGAGSGLRMNEAEISRIVGGRSKWQDLQAAINKWSLDPKAALSITPEQRQEIHSLTKTVADKITAKQSALQDARNGLIGTSDPDEHKKIVAEARQKMTDIDAGPKEAAKTYTQADVDAAVAAHPGMSAAQIESAFKAKNYTKQ